jgi:hypothetical protein
MICGGDTYPDDITTIPTIDDAGPDDEPGQKDMSQMSVDFTPLPAYLFVSWNWDEISWSGNNTGNACGLFDTDNDGFANYSLCIAVEGDANNVAVYKETVLYECRNDKSDRCMDKNPIAFNTT